MTTPPLVADPLLAWRARFPSVEGVLHFASHTLGAMPAEAGDETMTKPVSGRARSVLTDSARSLNPSYIPWKLRRKSPRSVSASVPVNFPSVFAM